MSYQSPYVEEACQKCEELRAEVSRLQTEVRKWQNVAQPLAARGVLSRESRWTP